MDATNNIAQDLFYKIRSRFTGLKLGAETGEVTINPEEARFFDFDYQEDGNTIGHVSISLAENNSMKVYFSTGITESMNPVEKKNWYKFLRELRMFAKRRLMSFDTRDITKDNLDKRDYMFLSQNTKTANTQPNTPITPVGESVMNESTLYGSKTMSYQKLEDTRLIIKHSHALADDMQPGARSRNISALFVENADGERFKYPFIHLAGARAMQRHVANGGMPYDDIGKSIINMSEEIAQLKSFGNYVVRNDLMNSDTNGIVERSTAQLNSLREMISKLAKQSHYEAYRESFQAQPQMEVPQDVVEDFTNKFTVRNFKEDIKSVFPVLYRLMQEDNTLGYNDIVAMTATEDLSNDDAEIENESTENYDPFAAFENWAIGLGEESAIQSSEQETKATAVKELQALVGQHFPAGDHGMNAIQSLKGIIDDPKLEQAIKKQAEAEGDDSCVRGLVKDWLEQNAPDVLNELDFGDFEEEGDQEDPEQYANDAADADAEAYGSQQEAENKDDDKESDDEEPPFEPDEKSSFKKPHNPNRTGMDSARALADKGMKMNVQEIAEFVHSFYDQESGTFPKGPEGVATMVGKKFGEQAEHVARKFVERMAPQQTTEQNPELAELARIRELSGMPQQEVDEVKNNQYSVHNDDFNPKEGDIITDTKYGTVRLIKIEDKDINGQFASGIVQDKQGRKIRASYEQLVGNDVEDDVPSENPRLEDAKKLIDRWAKQNGVDGDPIEAMQQAWDEDKLSHGEQVALSLYLKSNKSESQEAIELEAIRRLAGM